MDTTQSELSDVGPAIPPPNWCLPDAQPQWDQLADGSGAVCTWHRDAGDGVWIEAEDRIVDGRVMRSAPRIMYFEPSREGATCSEARELAEALIAAADIVTCAAFDEAAR